MFTVNDIEGRQAVHIIWRDSTQHFDWTKKEEAAQLSGSLCSTVGIVVENHEHDVVMALTVANEGHDNEQYCGIMAIPKRCIISVKLLVPSDD